MPFRFFSVQDHRISATSEVLQYPQEGLFSSFLHRSRTRQCVMSHSRLTFWFSFVPKVNPHHQVPPPLRLVPTHFSSGRILSLIQRAAPSRRESRRCSKPDQQKRPWWSQIFTVKTPEALKRGEILQSWPLGGMSCDVCWHLSFRFISHSKMTSNCFGK